MLCTLQRLGPLWPHPLVTLPTLSIFSTNFSHSEYLSQSSILWEIQETNLTYFEHSFGPKYRLSGGQLTSSTYLKYIGNWTLSLQYQAHRIKFQRLEILKSGCISDSSGELFKNRCFQPQRTQPLVSQSQRQECVCIFQNLPR